MTDIQWLVELDKSLVQGMSGSNSLFWDGFMWIVSETRTWLLAALMLLYIIFKNTRLVHGLFILVAIALVITLADQFASSVCKPFFQRFRPAQDPEIMYVLNIVNGYRGGLYGFISSHSANTFAFAMFVSLLIRNRVMTWVLFLWALIPSYSRIYLAVHYPGDVLGGAVAGCVIAVLVYKVYELISKKFFRQPLYISDQYTPSGFKIIDIQSFYVVILITCVYIVVASMVVAKRLFF